MSLSAIRQSLESIDYSWNRPSTYLVFVPVLSLAIEILQFQKMEPLPSSTDPLSGQNIHEANTKTRQFMNICKWHLMGSMTQVAVLAVAIVLVENRRFSLCAPVLATYCLSITELGVTILMRVTQSIGFYGLSQNGTGRTMIHASACTII